MNIYSWLCNDVICFQRSDVTTSVSSERTSSGRSLPKIPSSIRLAPVPPAAAPRTRQSKSVDLTPLCTSERSGENLLRRSTLADFESVKIVIDDVDSDHLKGKKYLRMFPLVLIKLIDC